MIIAIIQARIGSTRLPGKVLREVDGKPLLKMMLDRVKLAKKVDRVIVATSTLENDNAIAQFCEEEGVDLFRGSENDVLSRYYDCAKKYNATTIVRLTADCPLMDPNVIDKVVQLFQDEKADYAANTAPPEDNTFPDGSDVEVFSIQALARAHKEATENSDREHVTFYFWKDPSRRFKTAKLKNEQDWSKYRLTVDYPEDLQLIESVVAALFQEGKSPNLREIIAFLEDNPKVYDLNSQYYFGQGWKKA